MSSGKKAQNSKWKYVPPPGIEPITTCFPACRSNHSSRGRAYCTCFLSRFVEILLPYFYCGSGEVEHVQTDDLFVLIVALRHSRGYTYFSHICTRLDLPYAFLAKDINNREVKHTNVCVYQHKFPYTFICLTSQISRVLFKTWPSTYKEPSFLRFFRWTGLGRKPRLRTTVKPTAP